jgi:tellurite resistance protein
MIWLEIFLVGLALIGLGTWAYLYLPFRRSPEKHWRDQVLRLRLAVQQWLVVERNQLRSLEARRNADERTLRNRAFASFLATYSVTELEEYPGIGPATSSKLRAAGYTSLAVMQNARLRIEGLGDKRLTDVKNAIRDLTTKARSRFEAGDCREAVELAAQLMAIGSKFQEAELIARSRIKALDALLNDLRQAIDIAQHITLASYWKPHKLPLVIPKLLNTPLPDVTKALAAAEAEAKAALGAQQKSSQETSPADLPIALPTAMAAADGQASPMELVIQFAWVVARADGSIARKERLVIEEMLKRRFGSDAAEYERAKLCSAHYETAAIDLNTCLERIAFSFSEGDRRTLMAHGRQIAEATGNINQRESRLLEKVAGRWGLAPAPTSAAETVPAPPLPEAKPALLSSREEQLVALEIDPALLVSPELVRRQYNLLYERFEPQKVEAMGPEFVAMARSKREAVAAAATALLSQWGEELELPATPAAPSDLRVNPDLDAMFGV